MTQPTLFVFPISHYCEKAHWALEYLGVSHELRPVAPGEHVTIARGIGLRRGTVPFLAVDGASMQGSAEIVTWAESVAPDGAPALSTPATRDACLAIEQRLDEVAGVHARRLFYSEAVVEYPAMVAPLLASSLGSLRKLAFRATWPAMRALMIRGMDLGPEQRDASRDIIDQELDWLETQLSDGRAYLVGDAFTRADLTAASLLSPIALPDAHPFYSRIESPPKFAADLARWGDRPALAWVRGLYARHRGRVPG